MSNTIRRHHSNPGHGDTIVIADGNFPATSTAKNARLIPAYGLGVTELLEGILKFLPLDRYAPDEAVQIMQVVPGDTNQSTPPPIWSEFKSVIEREEGDWVKLTEVERFEFYRRASQAFAVVATSETAIYVSLHRRLLVFAPQSPTVYILTGSSIVASYTDLYSNTQQANIILKKGVVHPKK